MPERGSGRRVVGENRTHGGSHQWRKDSNSSWESSVCHSAIREELLDQASSNGRRKYIHGRRNGPYEHDKTSFVGSQQFWGLDRDINWPDILYQLVPDSDFLESSRPTPVLRWHGQVVLDHSLEPITDFPELPLTISSEVECEFIEAWTRTNRTLTLRDVCARMPPAASGNTYQSETSFNNKISMRVQRFRKNNGMVTWAPKAGSQKIGDLIVEWLDQTYPEARRQNSIKGIPPPPKDMVETLKKANRGTRSRKRRHQEPTLDSSESDLPLKDKARSRKRTRQQTGGKGGSHSISQGYSTRPMPEESENGIHPSSLVKIGPAKRVRDDSRDESDVPPLAPRHSRKRRRLMSEEESNDDSFRDTAEETGSETSATTEFENAEEQANGDEETQQSNIPDGGPTTDSKEGADTQHLGYNVPSLAASLFFNCGVQASTDTATLQSVTASLTSNSSTQQVSNAERSAFGLLPNTSGRGAYTGGRTIAPPGTINPCHTQYELPPLALCLDPNVQPLWMP